MINENVDSDDYETTVAYKEPKTKKISKVKLSESAKMK